MGKETGSRSRSRKRARGTARGRVLDLLPVDGHSYGIVTHLPSLLEREG